MTPIEIDLLERFTRYVQIDTSATEGAISKPSSTGQMTLLRLLQTELSELGWKETVLLETGYLIVKIPGTTVTEPLLFLAHVDTSTDAPGANVRPLVHRNYDGQPITLADTLVLDPKVEPYLAASLGDTVITSDGTTLLGSDDKAGVSELVSFAWWLSTHPDHPRPPLELVFTTDEEIGAGVTDFPREKVHATRGYTLDGGELGEMEDECYTAYNMRLTFTGLSHHPGDARGKLVNAVNMASSLIQMLPRSESPEATDGRYGCLWVGSIQGNIENCTLTILIRDFEEEQCLRRVGLVEACVGAVLAVYPGGKVDLKTTVQYRNMKSGIAFDPRIMGYLYHAMERCRIEPKHRPIRGGTDGARLTEMGLPCPNIFAGGANFHSRREWIPLRAMVSAVRVLIELTRLWAEGG